MATMKVEKQEVDDVEMEEKNEDVEEEKRNEVEVDDEEDDKEEDGVDGKEGESYEVAAITDRRIGVDLATNSLENQWCIKWVGYPDDEV